MAEKIPNDFVTRQLKDTQYISVAVRNELATIVGSKNISSTTGEVTDFLRSRWGLKKLFMQQTEERFRRMELWENAKDGEPEHKWVEKYVDENGKNIYKIAHWSKRYDHRHHAVDALVVALTTKKHLFRLNNLNKELQNWLVKNKEQIGLRTENDEGILEAFFNLEEKRRVEIQKQIESFRYFEPPFEDLISQAKRHLETIVVSHKPKDCLSIQKKEINKIQQQYVKIRGALHEATVYGNSNGRDTCTKSISSIGVKDIPKILCTSLAKQIDLHRKDYETMKEAFTGEGLQAFNAKRKECGQFPVYKVKCWYNAKEQSNSSLTRVYEDNGCYKVITGNNYLFAVMEKNRKRIFASISLFEAAKIAKKELKEHNTQFKSSVLEYLLNNIDNKDKKAADKLLFSLQIGDMVYMPDEDDEVLNLSPALFKEWISDEQNKTQFAKKVYRVVKFAGKECFFIPHNYANPITVEKDLSQDDKEKIKKEQTVVLNKKSVPKSEFNIVEFGSYKNCTSVEFCDDAILNLKNSKRAENRSLRKIQEYCYKLEIDWLGNVALLRHD